MYIDVRNGQYVNVFSDLLLSTELSVTISVNYTAAPGEVPGKLGPNEFTPGSILSLNCIVEGTSRDVTYSWSVIGNPTPPTECRRCNIDTSSTTSTLTVGIPLYSHFAGTYTCTSTVNETSRPDSSNSGDYTVTVVGEMMMCVLYMYCIIM